MPLAHVPWPRPSTGPASDVLYVHPGLPPLARLVHSSAQLEVETAEDEGAKAQKRTALDDDVERYFATGETDPSGSAFPAANIVDALTGYQAHLAAALLAEVQRRERGLRPRRLPDGFEPVEYARRKLQPMVNGLFPGKEREVVLGVLEQSVVFLTKQSVRRLVPEVSFLSSARSIANIYLGSIGAQPFEEPAPLGVSEGTTCYVSMEYFEVEDRFADYVIHEAAHIFHNTKRRTVGLPFTRHREWLLPIDFVKRETFAYGCEAYSRILEQARGPKQRRELLSEYADGPMPNDRRVDADELVAILEEAVAARNGWKWILARCSPPKRRRRGS